LSQSESVIGNRLTHPHDHPLLGEAMSGDATMSPFWTFAAQELGVVSQPVEHPQPMRAIFFLAMLLLAASVGVAHSDCIKEIDEFRERLNEATPTPQTAAAERELEKLDHNERADEIDCFNALTRARRALAASAPPTSPLPSREAKRYLRD
jgi:hypothetical protein